MFEFSSVFCFSFLWLGLFWLQGFRCLGWAEGSDGQEWGGGIYTICGDTKV